MVTLGFAFDLLTNFGTAVTKVLAHLLRRPEAIPISAEECFFVNNGRRNYDPGIKQQCFFIAGKEEFSV